MGKELEVAILNVDEKEVRRRLTELNAMHTGQYNFSRVELMLEGEIGRGKSQIRVKKLKEINERLGIRGDFVGNVSIDSIYRSYGKDFKAIVEKNKSRLMRLLEEDK